MVKIVDASGKRKTAIARAILKTEGKGIVKINSVPLETYQPRIAKERIIELFKLLDEPKLKEVDIKVSVKSGGIMSQTDAIRMAIARVINKFLKRKSTANLFKDYDNSLLSGDSRRKEPKKFGGKGARARRQKSFR
jgi:small subunit ribosomal protein S9